MSTTRSLRRTVHQLPQLAISKVPSQMAAAPTSAHFGGHGKPQQSFHSRFVAMPSEPMPQMSDSETDFETDSDFEEQQSHKNSFESYDSRRRSQTSISSFNEAPTPDPVAGDGDHFEIRFRPIEGSLQTEGPSGPHLFRSSSSSSDFDFKNVLQMSPVVGTKPHTFHADALTGGDGVTPVSATYLGGLTFDAAFQQVVDDLGGGFQDQIRTWSTQDVVDWMSDTGLDPSTIESFAQHDINGTVLLDLDFDDLKELDIRSFGKRHQLWTAICALRGDDENARACQPSASDSSRPPTRTSRRSSSRNCNRTPDNHDVEPAPLRRSPSAASGARRVRTAPEDVDEVLPGHSVSIVAIEQLLPKPHHCAKGENCKTWQKRNNLLKKLREEHGIDYSRQDGPGAAGRILLAGKSHSEPTETIKIANPHLLQPSVQECMANLQIRPGSEAMPSVVASSDLFGPGQTPDFALHEERLSLLGSRDPQDNVKQFLKYQHMNSPVQPAFAQPQPPPGLEMFPSTSVSAFPAAQPYHANPVSRPGTAGPREQLKALPKLDIPRSTSAGPSVQPHQPASASAARGPTLTPIVGPTYRLGTPASEMDVPYCSSPLATPISRDVSQSVPPNMQFNPPKRLSSSHKRSSKNDWRRPSMTLPAVKEGEILTSPPRKGSHDLARTDTGSTAQSASPPRRMLDPGKDEPETKTFGYGCTQSGWMRKRKTKMLRHEWQDAHFRLKGTQLAMHANARLSAPATETIDVEHYAVACSTLASNSKLSAAMKVFNLKADDKSRDATAFAFQLVPTAGEGKGLLAAATAGKTHHFAVTSKDERIDWMRELMLAKARHQKGKGYEVLVNGVSA